MIPEALQRAKLPRATVDLCLDSALSDEYDALKIEIDRSDALGAGGEKRARLTELKTEIEDVTLSVTLQGLSRKAYRELKLECPVRPGNDADKNAGFDVDAFHDKLVRACAVDPVMGDDGWAKLDESVTAAGWTRLIVAAIAVSDHNSSVPFSLPA